MQLQEGKVEEFKRLATRLMEIVRTKDTGTLQFEMYFNDDQSECIVLERYKDSEALLQHHAHSGELGQALGTRGAITGACLGEPSEALEAQLATGPIQLFRPYQSL